MLENILALFSLAAILPLLRRLVELTPPLIGCMVRGKENINLENSISLARSRDLIALTMILPFCLTIHRFSIYSPDFIDKMAESWRLPAVIGVFFSYILLRRIAITAVRPKRKIERIYAPAIKSVYNFFIITTLAVLTEGSLLNFMGIRTEIIQNVIIWTLLTVYLLFLIRKLQIFASSCSIITAFLYLCALELFPTGAVVASALIF